MKENIQLYNGLKIIGIVAAVYLVMKYIVPLIIPFLLGYVLVLMIHPIIIWIYKRIHICKGILGVIIIIVFVGLLGTGIWYLIHIIWSQLQRLLEQKEEIIKQYCGTYEYCCQKIGVFFGKEPAEMRSLIQTNFSNIYESMRKTLLPNLMSSSFVYIKKIFKAAGICIVGFISFILLLKDYDKIKEKVEETSVGKKAIKIGKNILYGVGAYLKAQGIIMIIIGSLCSITLFFIGSSYAILVGLLIGFLDAIPFIGTGIILIPWAVFVIIQGNFAQGFSYLGLYLVCSFLREYLEAKLVGNKLGVPPIMILVSIYMGFQLFGVGGFFLGPLSYMIISSILGGEVLDTEG